MSLNLFVRKVSHLQSFLFVELDLVLLNLDLVLLIVLLWGRLLTLFVVPKFRTEIYMYIIEAYVISSRPYLGFVSLENRALQY